MKLEIISAGIVIFLGVLILNPMHFWMPTMMHMAVLAAVVIAFGVFATYVLREASGDERENTHRMLASRAAYLTGGAVLLVAIIMQSLAESLDPWLVAALLAMILAKIIARVYLEQKN
jgi:hypothetical protein